MTFTLEEGGVATAVGSATTNASGLATVSGIRLTGQDVGRYAGAVTANFAGDSSDAASSATGALTVSPAIATLALGGLTDTYDGAPQAVIVSATPAGLTGVSVSYIQNSHPVAAPSAAGSYVVTATLDDPTPDEIADEIRALFAALER